MNTKDTLKKAREFIREQGGEVATLPLTEEELDPSAQDDQSLRLSGLELLQNPRQPVCPRIDAVGVSPAIARGRAFRSRTVAFLAA